MVAQLKRKLWKIFSEYIRRSHANTEGYAACYTCHRPYYYKKLHAGHCFSKGGHPATRFDEMNVKPQCVGCNLHKHGNSARFILNLQREYSVKDIHDLERRAKSVKKWTQDELCEMIDDYKEKLNSL